MLILESTRDVPAAARRSALAIGNFDGVHKGHQALLANARDIARRTGVPAAVLLFEPHPRAFFQPDKPLFRITPLPRKLALIEAYGLDAAIVLAFDKALASCPAETFVEDILVRDLAVSHVIVGYDFHFGKDRKGNAGLLRQQGQRHGFGVTEVAQVSAPGSAPGSALNSGSNVAYSSSAVRGLLAKGDVAAAAAMLGHWWRVSGTVVGGAKRGTGMGFPTANVTMPAGTDLGFGIYAVRVLVDGAEHAAAAYLGTRPTFDNGAPVLEVFLFDFDGDLYGKLIDVEFIAYLRGDRKFEGMEALKAQMAADCEAARGILARAGPYPSAPA